MQIQTDMSRVRLRCLFQLHNVQWVVKGRNAKNALNPDMQLLQFAVTHVVR